jgi:hypothetical protein
MAERLRWRLATLMDKLAGQCWADLVSWVLGDRGRLPWQPVSPVCRRDLARVGCCYCGKLRREEPSS